MTDWEKLKVAELKEELKSRGIPLTGLKLKQHFIDKLNELDTERDSGSVGLEQGSADGHGTQEDDGDSASAHSPSAAAEQQVATAKDTDDIQQRDQDTKSTAGDEDAVLSIADREASAQFSASTQEQGDTEVTGTSAEETTGKERVERLPNELPAELKKEESYARDGSTPPPIEVNSAAEEKALKKDDPFVLQESSAEREQDSMVIDGPEALQEPTVHENETKMQDTTPAADLTDVQSTSDPIASTRVPTPEILEDQRKRKRRSVTPAPDREDTVHKRVKANSGSPISTARELDALKRVQEATDAAQAIRDPGVQRRSTEVELVDPATEQDPASDNELAGEIRQKHGLPSPKQNEEESVPSPSRSSPERDVTPSIHPATCSLYIRNFKRPLHIPTLRNHISSLSGLSDQDQLKVFYLDSVRTHAFVSFSSISAASRVRNAMHETRFPNEPMRDPLWIDFIPDEKVQEWIDIETGGTGGGFGGGRGSLKKFEVVYNEDNSGTTAVLQETSTTNMQSQRSSVQQSRSSAMLLQDPTATDAVASGIHPSRARIVPQPSPLPRPQSSRPPAKPSDPGKGFRALDELFSSTTAKPKLYYKLPPQPVIDDRLDLIRDLRVNHDQMGQSGDEGMKRFSFEKDDRSGREEWVDKGPEFGFGRRGQERLTGHGSGYGGGRGRGGFRGARRGGDSWRGRS